MADKNTITDIHAAMEAIASAELKFKTDIWWRGHSVDKDWRLVPGVYRNQEADPYRVERNLATRFLAGAPPRHGSLPNFGHWNQWLVLMQHYGLPTRLLDWTASILTALYFAVRSHHDQDAALWAISPTFLNHIQVGVGATLSPGHSQAAPLFLPPFDMNRPQQNKIIAFMPTQLDSRMLIQQTGFTVHGYPCPIESLEQHEKFLIKWTIPSNAKQHLKAYLERLGTTESKLFPDLEHLAKEIAGLTFIPFESPEGQF